MVKRGQVDPNSKRQRGVDRHLHPRKVFHAPRELFRALEKFAKDKELTEADVQRTALTQFLAEARYYNPESG